MTTNETETTKISLSSLSEPASLASYSPAIGKAITHLDERRNAISRLRFGYVVDELDERFDDAIQADPDFAHLSQMIAELHDLDCALEDARFGYPPAEQPN